MLLLALPHSFLVPSPPPNRLTLNCVLLHKPNGVTIPTGKQTNLTNLVILVVFYSLSSYQTDNTAGKMLTDDEHSSNMQWHRSKNEL